MPLTMPAYDGLAPTGVVLKVASDTPGGQLHYAIRTSGAYGPGDGDAIRNGTGAVWTKSGAHVHIGAEVANGLTPEQLYYFGIVGDSGTAVGGNFTTPAQAADEWTGIPHTR